jgi:PKD repeat protein
MFNVRRVFAALPSLLLLIGGVGPASAQLPTCTDNVYFGDSPGRIRVLTGGEFTLSLPVTTDGYAVGGSAKWIHKKGGTVITQPTVNFTYDPSDLPSHTVTPTAAHRGHDNLMRVETTLTRQGNPNQSVESGCEEAPFTVQNAPTGNAGGPYSGIIGQAVSFTGAGTVDELYSDNKTPSFFWNFGDGATSTMQSPQHTYNAPGSYPVTLTVSDGFFTANSSTTATISAPGGTFSFENASYSVGELGRVGAVITRGGGSQDSATVTVTSSNLTAQSGPDYVGGTWNVSFGSGVVSQTVSVDIAADTIDENDEQFRLTITSASGPAGVYVGSPNQATVTITDDDPLPLVALSASAPQIAETGGAATVTASLSTPSGRDVTVALAFSGSAATTDYSKSASSIVIPAGQSSGSITLSSVHDTIDESNETVVVDIASATNATEDGVQSRTVTILDDDVTPKPGTPSLSITGVGCDWFSLSWTAASYATSYQLQRTRNLSTWSTVYSGSARSRTDYVPLPGTYYYQVRACNSSGCSAYSATRSARTACTE